MIHPRMHTINTDQPHVSMSACKRAPVEAIDGGKVGGSSERRGGSIITDEEKRKAMNAQLY